MNILLIGPQGSGKGTQAEKLVKKFNLFYLQTGGIFREIQSQNTPLGEKVASYMNKGILVPDDIVVEVVNAHLEKIGQVDNIIFDGFPRSIGQAEFFDKLLEKKGKSIDVVFFLTLSKEETIKRLGGRRICERCGKIFNIYSLPPKVEGVCDDCGGKLITRSDESPEAIETRLNEFSIKTQPLIDYYKARGIVEEIDGNRSIEAIFEDIVERLKRRGLIQG